MKRKIYQQLLDWKEKRNGEVALLIDGARRIGKSYIVEEFAKNEYESYILIDFNKAPQMVRDWQTSLDVVLINTKHMNGVILVRVIGI